MSMPRLSMVALTRFLRSLNSSMENGRPLGTDGRTVGFEVVMAITPRQ
jgi:hypothetical protein